MTTEMVAPFLPPRLLRLFVEAAVTETGADELALVLAGANLLPSAIQPGSFRALDGRAAASLYAQLQQALRAYYGRGARGLLLRIGRNLWDKILAAASLKEKVEVQLARALPVAARRKRVLEFLADRLSESGGSISVHTLDVDLMLVDHCSAAAFGQADDEPICWVTLGLIQAALYWAIGQEEDVEEIACRAEGALQCEFKIELRSTA